MCCRAHAHVTISKSNRLNCLGRQCIVSVRAERASKRAGRYIRPHCAERRAGTEAIAHKGYCCRSHDIRNIVVGRQRCCFRCNAFRRRYGDGFQAVRVGDHLRKYVMQTDCHLRGNYVGRASHLYGCVYYDGDHSIQWWRIVGRRERLPILRTVGYH